MSDLSSEEKSDGSTPPTTPGSTADEEKFLVNCYTVRPKVRRKWYNYRNIPFAILTVSFLQIIFHLFFNKYIKKSLRFEPSKRLELWRYITYMLVHDDWSHLALNVVIQCIFAALLEKRQGRYRVLFIYFMGGITGVLGAACVHPDLVIGASAGGYALLISNVADIILNFGNINYKTYRMTSIGILVLCDVIYDVVHIYCKKEPLVSWEAHFVGGLTGLLLGLVVFKNYEGEQKTIIHKCLFWTGLGLYVVIVGLFVILTVQISKCTPVDFLRYEYVYFC